MIFNSLSYLLLLFSVVLLYWFLPYRLRLYLIFFFSLVFYGFWKIEFIPVMLLSVIVDYVVSMYIPKSVGKKKKTLLLVSLFTNLGLLFYFKYLIFFSTSAIGILNFFGASIDPLFINIILPIGISFYTFQTISYTVDVYRGTIKPEKDFILYGCYVTFFPQLVAGPVLRAREVIPQFKNRIPFSSLDIFAGLRRIIYGLFLKVVLADNIAPLVDNGFLMPIENMSALDIWTLSFLFGFQIYFDFSAYSHIALGSARLIGIRFPENFNFPYIANSPKDFWRRWHISLSSWIRDYVYLPLANIKVNNSSTGGISNAVNHRKTNKSLIITWILMGLWHGANWTFLLWGVYHVIVILLYRLFSKVVVNLSDNLRSIVGIIITLPVMMLAWIPFRTQSSVDAIQMWLKIFNYNEYGSLGMRENTYLIAFILVVAFFVIYFIKSKIIPKLVIGNSTFRLIALQTMFFSLAMPLIFVFLKPVNQFIYFQF
jgi:alginate O-acetyltransferase complex protein AlgI